MSRFRVRIVAEAEAEFEQAFEWYRERSPMAAQAFRDEVVGAIDNLERDADLWPSDEDGIRYHVLTRFPYTVHFDFDGAVATVLAVAHHKRRPGYWANRT